MTVKIFRCLFKVEYSKSGKTRLFLLLFLMICHNLQVFCFVDGKSQQNHHYQQQYQRVLNNNNNNNRVADGHGGNHQHGSGHGMSLKSPQVSTNGWGSQPLKFNYQIVPAPAPVSHGWSEVMDHGEGESHGWGEEEGAEEEGEDGKLDGKDLLKTIVAIKALKVGKYFVLGKLLLLVMILAGIAKAGTILSPITLPLLALPIIITAALLFKPLLVLGFIIVAFASVLKEEKKGKKGGVKQMQNMHGGWGWAPASSSGHPHRRYTRSIPDLDFDLEEAITNILTRIDKSPLFFDKNKENWSRSRVW